MNSPPDPLPEEEKTATDAFSSRRVSTVLLGVGFAAAGVIACAYAPHSPWQRLAWLLGVGSLIASLISTLAHPFLEGVSKASLPGRERGMTDRLFHDRVSVESRSSFLRFSLTTALLLGATAALLEGVLLMKRFCLAAVELATGLPRQTEAFGFDEAGLGVLAALFVSCLVSWRLTRHRLLPACLLWTAAALGAWACLLEPMFRMAPGERIVRTTALSSLTLVTACTPTAAVLFAERLNRRARRRIARMNPEGMADRAPGWPGLRASCAFFAFFLLILVSYHWAVPMAVGGDWFRWPTVAASTAAMVMAGTCFWMNRRAWSAVLADLAIGLTSLSIAGIPLLLLPPQPPSPADRYPLVFNALMIGFAAATWFCTRLAATGNPPRRETAPGSPSPSIPTPPSSSPEQRGEGISSWARDGRWIPHLKRFAFLNAALALVTGILMAAWPRLPWISATDDSFGRVISGLGANLCLLAVMLWCSRRLRRTTFSLLTVLVLASAITFVAMRFVPFTAWTG